VPKKTRAKSVRTARKPAGGRASKVARSPGGNLNNVRLARVPKGKRPQYFSDPAIDKLLWTTITLAQELAVTRDRLDTMEQLLTDKRVLKSGAVDSYVAPPAVEGAREAARMAYVARVMRAVEAELEETTRADNPRSQDDVIAAVSQ